MMNSANRPKYNPANLEGRSTPERRAKLQKPKTRKVSQRLKKPPLFKPRERHYQILEWLAMFRILTQKQFETLLERHRGSVQPVLRTLFDNRWVDRILRPVVPGVGDNTPIIYTLGKEGMIALQQRGFTEFYGVTKQSNRYWFDHALDINTFSIAFQKAYERDGFVVESWLDERSLKTPGMYDRVAIDGDDELTAVIGDTYYKVRTPSGLVYRFWVEMDEGTETLTRIKRKVEAWLAYYKSGGMQERFGGHGRILFITPHKRRLDNLIKTAEAVPGIGRRFWFGLLSELTPDQIFYAPVWQIARDGEAQEKNLARISSLFETPR